MPPLQWGHMSAMVCQITGNSIVWSTVYYGGHQRSRRFKASRVWLLMRGIPAHMALLYTITCVAFPLYITRCGNDRWIRGSQRTHPTFHRKLSFVVISNVRIFLVRDWFITMNNLQGRLSFAASRDFSLGAGKIAFCKRVSRLLTNVSNADKPLHNSRYLKLPLIYTFSALFRSEDIYSGHLWMCYIHASQGLRL